LLWWCVIFGALALRRSVDDSIRNTHSGTEPGFDLDAAIMISPKETKDESCRRSRFPVGGLQSQFSIRELGVQQLCPVMEHAKILSQVGPYSFASSTSGRQVLQITEFLTSPPVSLLSPDRNTHQ
jgi:hypothetical protein